MKNSLIVQIVSGIVAALVVYFIIDTLQKRKAANATSSIGGANPSGGITIVPAPQVGTNTPNAGTSTGSVGTVGTVSTGSTGSTANVISSGVGISSGPIVTKNPSSGGSINIVPKKAVGGIPMLDKSISATYQPTIGNTSLSGKLMNV